MRVKIVIGIILAALCMFSPIAYMTIREAFGVVVVGIPARIILTAIFMLPCFSLLPLEIWSMKVRGESFDLLTEWYR